MSMPRFIVVHAGCAIALESALVGYDDYEVVKMTSGPWFDKSGQGNTLEQTGDSIYVLLELRRADVVINMPTDADPKPDPPGRCGRRHKR